MVAKQEALKKEKTPFINKAIGIASWIGYRIWVEPKPENAFKTIEKLQRKNPKAGGILNILGEHHKTREVVEKDLQKYRNLIESIVERRKKLAKKGKTLNVAISIKPTQLGWDADDIGSLEERKGYTLKNMKEIVEKATANGINVEMDVESSPSHEFTYDAFKNFARELTEKSREGMLGVAIQANYTDACKRMEGLMDLDPKKYGPLKFRLVKGIYKSDKDPSKLLIEDEKEMITAYQAMVKTALEHKNRDKHKIALASHREDILEKGGDEAQVLKGIRYGLRYGTEKEIPYAVYLPIGSRKAAGAYAERRGMKAAGLLKKTALDLLSPFYIWMGGWHKQAKEKAAAKKN